MSNPQDERAALELAAQLDATELFPSGSDRCQRGAACIRSLVAENATLRAALANQRAEAQQHHKTCATLLDGGAAGPCDCKTQPEAVPQGGQWQASLIGAEGGHYARASAPPSPQPPAALAQPIGYISPDRLDAMKRGECDTIPLICEAGAELTGVLGRADIPVYLEPPAAQATASENLVRGNADSYAEDRSESLAYYTGWRDAERYHGIGIGTAKPPAAQAMGPLTDEQLREISGAADTWVSNFRSNGPPYQSEPEDRANLIKVLARYGIGTAKPAQPTCRATKTRSGEAVCDCKPGECPDLDPKPAQPEGGEA